MIKPEEFITKEEAYRTSVSKQITTISDLKHVNIKESAKFTMIKIPIYSIQSNKY